MHCNLELIKELSLSTKTIDERMKNFELFSSSFLSSVKWSSYNQDQQMGTYLFALEKFRIVSILYTYHDGVKNGPNMACTYYIWDGTIY